MKNNKINVTFNLWLLIAIFLFGVIFTVPLLSKIRPHSDEHQFFLNSFSIMGGEELHNYVHVALTEYALSIFFLVVNMITDSGVNFPQGTPTVATEFYGRVFGFILYVIVFALGVLILQREDKKIKLRSVVFATLYFGSAGLFERFLRINSDSMLIFVFLNFFILSFSLHKRRASIIPFFLLNTVFLFLGTFTNVKSLFIMLPLLVFNTLAPFLLYRNPKDRKGLLDFYWMILYGIGVVVGIIFLWVKLAPRPFSPANFWYTVKKTIVHGTGFDFDFPSQAYDSWAVYIYDFFVEYVGLFSLLALVILFVLAYRLKGKGLSKDLLQGAKSQMNLDLIKKGDLYFVTEGVLLVCFIFYYLGVSSRVIHWSRWGAPLGIVGILILSTVAEKLIEVILRNRKKLTFNPPLFFLGLFALTWILRVMLFIDLKKTNYPDMASIKQSDENVEKFLREKNISPEDGFKKVAWISGYTGHVKNFPLENISLEENRDVTYLLWPKWYIRTLYTDKNIDRSYHNWVAFINAYTDNTEYRLPSLMSHYAHYTEFFAARYLGIAWNTELDSLIENQFGVTKLKKPVDEIRLNYEVRFSDMSHYYSPYSRTFNMGTLKDSYMFPTCYVMQQTRYVKDGELVPNHPEIGPWARTAELNCHSVRFWNLFPGKYIIRVEGLPENDNSELEQMVYSNVLFEWDTESKTITAEVQDKMFSGEFGVAIEEERVPGLKYRVFYSQNLDSEDI